MPPMLFTALCGLIFNLFFGGVLPEGLMLPAGLDGVLAFFNPSLAG